MPSQTTLRPRGAPEVLVEAIAHQDAGHFEEAAAALRRVLALVPGHAEAHTRLGWVLVHQGLLDEAITAHREATHLQPGFAAAWSNLGVALQAKGEHDEALRVLQHAVALDPSLAESRVNLGNEWQARGMASLATACHRQALAFEPRLAAAWINLGLSLQEAGDTSLAIAATREALRLQPGSRQALSNLAMTAQYASGLSLAGLRRTAKTAGTRFGAEQAIVPRAPWAAGARRLRVGYVSGDLYAHPVGWMASRALRAHDCDKVEVHVYADGAMADFLTEEIRTGVEHWHPVHGMGDDALCALVVSHDIDVLVDLAGHTQSNRLAFFARRAAPVQLSWLGFAASTGVPAIDGVILGGAMAPTGAEDAFTEPLVRLGRIHFTYRPPDYAPPVSPPPCERSGHVTLGSFNNPAKLGMDVLCAWALILSNLPGTKLLLKSRTLGDPAAADRIRRRFALLGVDPSRLELRGASTHPEMLAEYGDVDVALDPFPFCGGLTTCEALWMGVPVVTLPWLRPMSRQGQAILGAVGLADLVASTPRDYVALACRLAKDAPRLSSLRRELRGRIEASELFDGRSLSRELETAFIGAVKRRAMP